MRLTLTLISLTSLLLTIGCKKGLEDKEKIVDVDKEFNIQLWDRLSDNSDNLQLNIATIKEQDCEGVRIRHYANTLNNRVIVTLNSLEVPSFCNGIKEPAHDTVQIAPFTAAGKYEFHLNLKDAVFNKGYLTVDDTKFKVEMEQENGISIAVKEILRVPQNTMWGFVAFENGQDKAAETMLDSLKSIATVVNFVAGDYGYFKFDNGTTTLPESFKSTKPNVRPFLLRLNNKMALASKLAAFRNNNSLDFMMMTSNGQVFKK